ncbi:hypothetical protein [Microbispora sp. H10670]|nr:hypothetical protein [Microbispora sp. H10670]
MSDGDPRPFDAVLNVEAARALGMTGVLFTGVSHLEAALTPLLG